MPPISFKGLIFFGILIWVAIIIQFPSCRGYTYHYWTERDRDSLKIIKNSEYLLFIESYECKKQLIVPTVENPRTFHSAHYLVLIDRQSNIKRFVIGPHKELAELSSNYCLPNYSSEARKDYPAFLNKFNSENSVVIHYENMEKPFTWNGAEYEVFYDLAGLFLCIKRDTKRVTLKLIANHSTLELEENCNCEIK